MEIPCQRKTLRICSRRAPSERSTAMSRALSVTVMERTTRILRPATKVINPMKMAVTNFSKRNARNKAWFSSIQVVAEKPGPAARCTSSATSAARSGWFKRNSRTLTRSPAPARPSAAARNQPERSQPSLRACNRHVITGRDFPLLRKLFADKQGLDTVWIGRKVQLARDNALECLIAFSFALGINALGHYAACLSGKREQDGLINGRCDGANSGQNAQFPGHFLVVLDAS